MVIIRIDFLDWNIPQNSKKDEKTDSILKIIDGAKWFEDKLIKDDLGENLRSFVAHKQSISEGLKTCFQVHRLSQVLLYDMESQGVPFFKTAYEMGKNLSFVILNMLALFTTKQIFNPTHYNPNWKNRSQLYYLVSLTHLKIGLELRSLS